MIRWGSLPLSVIGRVNLVKMIILPKSLYLFKNIPISIKKCFFKTLDEIIIFFIYRKKPSRISKTHLQRSKLSRGLALPNFLFYYWACSFQKLLVWRWSRYKNGGLRATGTLIMPIPPKLSDFVMAWLQTLYDNSIKIWSQFRKHFEIQSPSTVSPIKMNHIYPILYRSYIYSVVWRH